MLVLGPVVLAVLLVPVLGGRLGALGRVRFHCPWLLWLALGAQIAVISVFPTANATMLALIHIYTYALAGRFVWLNRHVPGLPVLGVGAACNGVTIALNGGVLPASAHALERSGFVLDPGEFTNSGVLPDPVLPWLGDILWVPAGWPLANVFSIGDILIVAGAVWGVHRICASRLAFRRGEAAATSVSEAVGAPTSA